MPTLSGVFKRLNVIIDGEVRGLFLTPMHVALTHDLSWQSEPCRIESVVVYASDGKSMSAKEAVAKGVAVLEGPYYGVPSEGMVGDIHVWTEEGLLLDATNPPGRPDRTAW